MPTGKPLTDEIKNKVVELYKSRPISISECGRLSNLSSPTVIKILDEFNVKRYKKAKIFNPELDESYFENIDSEHKAYWLGFLITDGNVHIPTSGNRQASISITQSDDREYILNEFLKDIKAGTTIGHDGRGTSAAAVRSDIMAKDLEQYGIVPNKTLDAYLPNIDKKLIPHMIRGILDGDGNVPSLVLNSGKHKHSISFCGTHKLMEDLSTTISNELGVQKAKIYDYTDRHLSEVKWQSIDDCFAIGEWIYNEATIYIKDKKETYINFTNHYKK